MADISQLWLKLQKDERGTQFDLIRFFIGVGVPIGIGVGFLDRIRKSPRLA